MHSASLNKWCIIEMRKNKRKSPWSKSMPVQKPPRSYKKFIFIRQTWWWDGANNVSAYLRDAWSKKVFLSNMIIFLLHVLSSRKSLLSWLVWNAKCTFTFFHTLFIRPFGIIFPGLFCHPINLLCINLSFVTGSS